MHTVKAWKELVDISNQLEKPSQIHNLLLEQDIICFKNLIKEIINAFLERGEHHIGLKTYVNQELNHSIVEKMLGSPPKDFQSIEAWCKQIFGDDKFGMVLNTLEGYNNAFSEKAAELVGPLLQEAGLPLQGLSFLFFMGNYGFTPFGIHKESRGEEGMLFHLGPGKKTFYTWDSPEYNTIEHYQDSLKNIDEMLPSAKAYELNPGDVMFIPHQVFHIANSSEFSLSFVMDYINPQSDQFENKLLEGAAKEALVLKNDYQTPLQYESQDHIDKLAIIEKINIAFRRQLMELKSNAGILRKSLIINKNTLPNGNFQIKSKPIFPLFFDRQGDDKLIVFARGHRLIKPFHSNFEKLMNRFNLQETIQIEEIFQNLQPQWDMIDVLSFISDLNQIEAIDIIIE